MSIPRARPSFRSTRLGLACREREAGRRLWRRSQPLVGRGLELGRSELNETRSQLGLPALAHVHGGISRRLALVGTFPQLEYPRRWPAHVHVVGPLMWEPPDRGCRAAGSGGPDEHLPLVLIAPSTAQDAEHRLLRAALEGLADAPVRVLATWNRRLPSRPLPVPENARLVRLGLLFAHDAHAATWSSATPGTAPWRGPSSSGCAVVACPAVGDMNENAARLDWAGAGVRLPRRFVSPGAVRLAVERTLGRALDP